MARHIRNLLMMAALCWVAPVSAQQPPPAAREPLLGGGCPHAQRGGEVIVVSEEALGEAPVSAGFRAFMP
jgi:hypothetical protein